MRPTRTEAPTGDQERRERRRSSGTLRGQEARAGLGLISPTVIVVLVVVIAPVLWTLLLAFRAVRLANLREVGLFGEYTLENLQDVFDSDFWSSLWVTLVYSVAGTVLSIGIGLVVALAVRRPFRGRTVVRASALLPYVAPVVAVTFVWQIMLNPQFGIVNEIGTELLGWDEPMAFLTRENVDWDLGVLTVPVPMALLTVIAFEAWRYFPFAFLFLTARLQAVPVDLEEAAIVDGATPWQRFRHVVLPQLGPVIALLCVLRFIWTFNKFDDVYLLTGGGAGTEVVSVRVFNFLYGRSNVGLAAAQALVLAGVLVVFLVVYLRFFARRIEEQEV